MLYPQLDFAANLTWNFYHIEHVWYIGFQDFLQYLYEVVYDHAINSVVLNWSVALLFFMLFLSFIVGFIFMTRK